MDDNWAEKVTEFNTVNGYPAPINIGHPPAEVQVLRLRLMMEELGELATAMHEKNILEVTDGLCDLLYVTVGTAVEYGLGPVLYQLFAEVHRSNMTKFQGEIFPGRLTDDIRQSLVKDKYSGKVKKGAHFEPPRLAEIIDEYADNLKKINEE